MNTGGTPPRRLFARVSGRVQGVGFRATTVDVARRLGLGGWVRNLPTGEVELEAEGPDEALDALLAFLQTGPRGARVDGVSHHRESSSEQQSPDQHVSARLPIPFEVRRG